MKVEELKKKTEKKQECQDRLKGTYDRVKKREDGDLEEEWGLMKESFAGHASDVSGERFVGGCMRRGSEWWNEGVEMKVEEKKRAFEEWLQCSSMEKNERYREKNVETKWKVTYILYILFVFLFFYPIFIMYFAVHTTFLSCLADLPVRPQSRA